MSTTRTTRRSGAGDSAGLNPATIQLLSVVRIKQELEARGLDSKGAKNDLAFRLEEHVRLAGGFVVNSFDPSPTPVAISESADGSSHNRGRPRKRKADEIAPDENTELQQEALQSELAPIRFQWACAPPPSQCPMVKEQKKEEVEEDDDEEEEEDRSGLKICSSEEEEDPEWKEAGPSKRSAELVWTPTEGKFITEKYDEKSEDNQEKVKTSPPKKQQLDLAAPIAQSTVVGSVDDIIRKRKELKKEKKRKERERREKEEAEQKRREKETTKLQAKEKMAEKEKEKKKAEKVMPKQKDEKKKGKEEIGEKQKTANKEKHHTVSVSSTSASTKNKPEKIDLKSTKQSSTESLKSQNYKQTTPKAALKPPSINSIQSSKPLKIPKTSMPSIKIPTGTPKSKTLLTPPISASSSLDIFDTIMDSQQQLLTRKQKQREEEEEQEEAKQMDSTHRQQQLSAGAIGPQQQKQQRRMSITDLLTSPPPPPLPPLKSSEISSPSYPVGESSSPRTDNQDVGDRTIPLVINSQDPLGLSLVGPDTPLPKAYFPPPPPPPPKKIPPKVQQIATAIAADEEAYFPPPPPPPPKKIPPKVQQIATVIAAGEEDGRTDAEDDQSQEGERLEVHDGEEEEEEELSDEGTFDDEEDDEESEEEVGGGGEEEKAVDAIQFDEDGEGKPAEYGHLLRDPKALLRQAQDVLRRKFGGDSDADISASSAHYEQVGLSIEEFKNEAEDEEIRQLPDPDQFHGEPVPDDMDDDLFEIAAGLPPRNKKKDQEPKPVEDEPLPDAEHVELDFYNSDLNMKSAVANKWLIEPDNGDGFALMWGGVRANWGVSVPEEEAKRAEMPPIAFQVKITEFLSLKHLPFEEMDPHQIRVGWSRAGTSNMLGESQSSYAFCSIGNKATRNVFSDFGDPFHIDDVITSVLDIGRAEIRYYKNGQPLGAAFTEIQLQTGDVFFPHVVSKNCKIMVNFGTEAPEPVEAAKDDNGMSLWSMPADEIPEETEWIGIIDRRSMAPSRRPILDKSQCTIIAMVGLAGVGKTTWVRQYLKEHPEENWILLNTDTVLQAMTVNGMPRQRVHQGRWDMVMGLTAKALSRSLQMACRRRHNYILDQTNAGKEARKRKLTQFQDFQRKCVVIIPNEAEHERRLIKQAREAGGGGQMPAEAMLEMKGLFSIPCTESEPIEDVIFVEPPVERINEAIEQVKRYNQEGRPWVRNLNHQRTRGPESLISDHSGLPPPQFLGVTRIGV